MKKRLLVLLLLIICGGVPTVAGPSDFLPVNKILFFGNSITLHGPSAAIGWDGNWGMAASKPEKDYVHVVARSVADATGIRPEIKIVPGGDFERHYESYDIAAQLKDGLEFRPDIVIVAIGENVPPFKTADAKAQFKRSLLKLLEALKVTRNTSVIVRSCFFPDPTKDEILKGTCAETGEIFVDISNLAKDESNYARSEREFKNIFVAKHPGDRGMQSIATALVGAMEAHGLLGGRRHD